MKKTASDKQRIKLICKWEKDKKFKKVYGDLEDELSLLGKFLSNRLKK